MRIGEKIPPDIRLHDVSKHNDRAVHCKEKKPKKPKPHGNSTPCELILTEAETYLSAGSRGKVFLRGGQISDQDRGPSRQGRAADRKRREGRLWERSGHAPPGARREGPGACGATRGGRLRRREGLCGADEDSVETEPGPVASSSCQPQVRRNAVLLGSCGGPRGGRGLAVPPGVAAAGPGAGPGPGPCERGSARCTAGLLLAVVPSCEESGS